MAATVLTGLILGVLIPIDISFLSENLDVAASMLIYPVTLIVIFYFLFWASTIY